MPFPSCGEFGEVVGGADQRPLAGDFLDATQKELTKAASCFDLAEHGLDDVLAQPIAAAVTALS